MYNPGIALPATYTETRNDQNTQAAPLNTHVTPTITMPAAGVQLLGAYFLSNSYVNRQKIHIPEHATQHSPPPPTTYTCTTHTHKIDSNYCCEPAVHVTNCDQLQHIREQRTGNAYAWTNHSLRLLETDKRASLESST